MTSTTERRRLTLSLPPEDIEIIRSDSRALGMTMSTYVAMACKTLNSSAEQVAKGLNTLAASMSEQVMKEIDAQQQRPER